MVLQTIVELREGKIDVSRGMAIAACLKVVNDNIQVEINAAKLAASFEGTAHNFGRVSTMGRRLIGTEEPQDVDAA